MGVLVIDRRSGPSFQSRVVTTALDSLLSTRGQQFVQKNFGPELATSMERLDVLARWMASPRGTRTTTVTVNGVGAEWVHGPGVGKDRSAAILYLHGGAWFLGGLYSHRGLISRVSAAAGMPALALNYRLVPTVSFDEMLNDCVAGYQALLDLGIPATQIVVMGDSAGGHLTFTSMLRARRLGLPLPGALVGMSGVYDLDPASKAAHTNGKRDPSSIAALAFLFESVLAGADPRDPEFSPVRADLSGLPPVLLVASSSEIVYSDSEELGTLLAAAGTPCTLQVWHRQLHVFQLLGRIVPESRRSINDIGKFVRRAVARG